MVPPRGICGTAITPGQQMQLGLDAAGQFPVLDLEVFRIPDDRVADMRHVRAQLVRAAGDRLERDPGKLLRRGLDHRVIRHGMIRRRVLPAVFARCAW